MTWNPKRELDARIRRRSHALLALLLGSLLLAALGAAKSDERGPAPVNIEIDEPAKGEVVKNKVTMARIRGVAHSGSGEPSDFDVMIALDVSSSTRYPSGIDVDEDGDTGINPEVELVAPGTYPEGTVCSDPDDTILAAEIQAARYLLDVLDPARTQVGVMTFSGIVDPKTGERKSADQKDAWVNQALTSDFSKVQKTLDAVLAKGPYGATNYAAAIQLGVVELAGLSDAVSKPRAGARKVILFLTDGVPTFPFGKASSADPEDTEAAINAARLAKAAGITINSFALGRQALAAPVAVTEIANLTVGTYTPVRNPGDIVGFLQGVSFANIEDVVIKNLTTNDLSFDVQLSPDGSFAGFVPVKEGKNQLQVTALATDGGEAHVDFDLEFEKSGLTERELMVELERTRKRNKALMLLLERKRIEAFRKRQGGKVTVEAEDDDTGKSGDKSKTGGD